MHGSMGPSPGKLGARAPQVVRSPGRCAACIKEVAASRYNGAACSGTTNPYRTSIRKQRASLEEAPKQGSPERPLTLAVRLDAAGAAQGHAQPALLEEARQKPGGRAFARDSPQQKRPSG